MYIICIIFYCSYKDKALISLLTWLVNSQQQRTKRKYSFYNYFFVSLFPWKTINLNDDIYKLIYLSILLLCVYSVNGYMSDNLQVKLNIAAVVLSAATSKTKFAEEMFFSLNIRKTSILPVKKATFRPLQVNIFKGFFDGFSRMYGLRSAVSAGYMEF